jgi:hypothetical protein
MNNRKDVYLLELSTVPLAVFFIPLNKVPIDAFVHHQTQFSSPAMARPMSVHRLPKLESRPTFDHTSIFALSSVAALLATACIFSFALLHKSTNTKIRILFTWHLFDALIHLTLEASYLYDVFFISMTASVNRCGPRSLNSCQTPDDSVLIGVYMWAASTNNHCNPSDSTLSTKAPNASWPNKFSPPYLTHTYEDMSRAFHSFVRSIY